MIVNLLMYTCARHCHKRWSSGKAIAKIKRCSFFASQCLSPLSPSFSAIDKTLTGASLEVMWSFLTLWRNWFHRSLNHSDLGVALLSHSSAQVVAKVALLVFCSNSSGMVNGPSSSRWDDILRCCAITVIRPNLSAFKIVDWDEVF